VSELASEEPTRRERPGKIAILKAAVEVMGEDGYEGASIRDMAARAGVSVAALYYHFPSKLDLLREFLDEAWNVTLARLDRRLDAAGSDPTARLDAIVGTLISSHLHDEFSQLASNVAFREYTRLNPPERKSIDVKRRSLLALVEGVLAEGNADGSFAVDDVREAARAVLILATSLVEPYREMDKSLDDVIETYQGFARAIARNR
jgi:AcrR family transcriptional regulator